MAEKFQYTAIQELDLVKANKIKLIDKLNELYGYDTQLTWTSTWGELQTKISELKTLLPEQDEEIHDELEAFLSNSGIGSIKTASSSINEYSFYKKNSLISVEAPLATSIGQYAFYNCSNLTMLSAELVESVGAHACNNCSQLATLNLPSVTTVKEYAFSNCTNLAKIKMPALTKIDGRHCFSYTSLNSLSGFDQSIWTYVGPYAFEKSKLSGEIILDGSYEVGEHVFAYDTEITSIVITESMTKAIGAAQLYAGSYSSKPATYAFKYFLCEAESKPNTWASDWNYTQNFSYSGNAYAWPVYWDAKFRDYTFVLNNGQANITLNKRILDNGDLPAITRSGYKFDCWCTDSTGVSSSEVVFPYISSAQTTLYARWLRQVKLIAVNIEEEYTETDLGIYAYKNITEMPDAIRPYLCLGYYSSYDSSTHTFADIVADIYSLVGDIPVVYIKACYSSGKSVDMSFSYVESSQEATLGPGNYTFYCWGAQGLYGKNMTDTTSNYYGGFASGKIRLNSQQTFYIYTGGKPGQNGHDVYTGGWNGGGGSYSGSSFNDNAPGGGATDICLVSSAVTLDSYKRYVRTPASYLSRILVAGGGGGGRSSSGSVTFGGYCPAATTSTGSWGSLTSAGTNTGTYVGGGFGYGASGTSTSDDTAGGGGGWYGGGSQGDSYGGAGSSFAWTSDYANYVPSGYSVSTELYLTEPVFLYGSAQQPTFTDVSTTAAGHVGNGCARIIGTSDDASRNIPAKVVTIIGIESDGTQHELYTTSILHNLRQSDLSETSTEWIIISDYYLDETLSIQLTLPHSLDFDNTILYIYCSVEENPLHNFEYSGESKTCTLSAGTYKLECWGAQGGNSHASYIGGKGGYSTGILEISEAKPIYIYVAGQGVADSRENSGAYTTKAGGFNGGGSCYSDGGCGSGGGASDIRLGTDSLYARVIVAGGGGGAGWTSSGYYGGGLTGGSASGSTSGSGYFGGGGSQTAGGNKAVDYEANGGYSPTTGTFGNGGFGVGNSSGGGGAGGGWYGGGGSGYKGGSGGGSGYVYTSDTAVNYPTGCLLSEAYYLSDAKTIAGNSTFTSPDGTEETGHSGNGYVRITKIKS